MENYTAGKVASEAIYTTDLDKRESEAAFLSG